MTQAAWFTQAREDFYAQLATLFPNMQVFRNECLIHLPDGGVTVLHVASYPNVEEWEKRWLPKNDYLLKEMKEWVGNGQKEKDETRNMG